MKFATLVLATLLLSAAAFAQEPENHAVLQPTVRQSSAVQPALEPQAAPSQPVNIQPPPPYLSQPLNVPPRQLIAHPRVRPVIEDLRQDTLKQPMVLGTTTR